MPSYSWDWTVPPNTEAEYAIVIEGETVTWFSLTFPPGPAGLLEVSVYYGEKKVWPSEEEQVFKGDNCTVEFTEDWPLPETPCRLRVYAVNRDDTYPHTFFLRLKTSPAKPKAKVKFRVTEEGFIEVAL